MNKASVLDTRIYGHLLVATVEYSNANMHVKSDYLDIRAPFGSHLWICDNASMLQLDFMNIKASLEATLNSLHMQVWWIGLLRYWGTFLVATNEYGTACKYVEVGLHEYTGTFWWPLVKCTTGKMSVETRKPSRCNGGKKPGFSYK